MILRRVNYLPLLAHNQNSSEQVPKAMDDSHDNFRVVIFVTVIKLLDRPKK